MSLLHPFQRESEIPKEYSPQEIIDYCRNNNKVIFYQDSGHILITTLPTNKSELHALLSEYESEFFEPHEMQTREGNEAFEFLAEHLGNGTLKVTYK